MSLLDFQIDLQETNRQLARIADALERLAPLELPAKGYDGGPRGKKVASLTPAATWPQVKEELESQGRHDEVMAGAYGPRSLKRD